MMQSKQRKFIELWGWCAAILGLSALVGIWNAENPQARTLSQTPAKATLREETHDSAVASRLEKIESTLAQAGCPGWITLASEGEAALLPPAAADPSPGSVQPAALNVAQSSSLFPAPVQVANRALFAPPAAKLSLGAADDPDDLLDGVPDLLIDSPQAAQPAEQSAPTEPQPTIEPQPTTEPLPTEVEKTPPTQETTPAPVTQQEKVPTLKVPTEQLPTQPVPPEQPVKPQTRPAPVFAPPRQLEREPAPTIPAPAVSAPIQPAPVQPSVTLPPLAPEPIEQGPIIQEPAEQEPVIPEPITPPVKTAPQQSPFSPPPTPVMPTPHSVGSAASDATSNGDPPSEKKTYCEYVAETQYPSAHVCAKCHQQLFDEWSVSSHAYAAISPMFHKFEQKINDLSQGTIGYFCYRCHAPVGTNLGVSRAAPLWELPQVAREGVTCIACHRVNQRYGKVNGERRIEPGGVHDPVYGSIGGSGVAEVTANKNQYKVKTFPGEQGLGQDIHAAGVHFDQLSKSEFCVSCHQVAVQPGIKLEVVWEQYRASPACKKGISCQDCHMGRIPGVASGYEYGAAAKIGDKVVNSKRKHANHIFYGPGYSIAHPGIFPHNAAALRWSMRDWLLFDWRAGWGTDEFEKLVEAGHIRANFPPVWAEVDDRYDARDIIADNQKKLQLKTISRQQVMENGSHVDGPYFDSQLVRGQDLKFHYIMTNTNEGHNLPSGSLGAQPQLWANVVLIGPRGQRLWESGYTDSWGDVADIHSEDVRNKRIPYDWQLFNLQTMFLITGAKGTDREFFLPVNIDIDQLPYLRPGAQPISVINHPPFIRMEGRSLAPLGSKKIPYRVPAHLMREPGHYRLSFRLRSRAEPIYFMRFCGSTQEMNRAMNEGIVDFHQSSLEFIVK